MKEVDRNYQVAESDLLFSDAFQTRFDYLLFLSHFPAVFSFGYNPFVSKPYPSIREFKI